PNRSFHRTSRAHAEVFEGYCRGRRHFFASRKGDRVWTRSREGKASEKPHQKACKRGGKVPKRGLSAERVPFWPDPSVPVLPAVNADTLREVLAPVMDKDALLVTDGETGFWVF
ncbi:MAG: hypothetical protein GDA36_13780, partial [Rhodobacteraceae bacterium]|nr:hypothetical protein [Paracoccaceae bacterium]